MMKREKKHLISSKTSPKNTIKEQKKIRQEYYAEVSIECEAKKGRNMAIQQTLSIIKPDATKRHLTGAINQCFEEAGLHFVAQKRLLLTCTQAEKFYAVHKERNFFNALCAFMVSGPIVVQVLEGENAVEENRRLMGATNPANAADNTIRKKFALSIEENTVHGSDSLENAAAEISFFFSESEIVG